jgi:adenylate cyclase
VPAAGDRNVDLRPKAFEVLRLLVENAGRPVSKQELYDAVWPRVTVTDDVLIQCIRELRQLLGDHDHSLIKTVSRRGYLLDATVTRTASQDRDVPIVAQESSVAMSRGNLPVGLQGRHWRVIGLTALPLATLLVAGVMWTTMRANAPTSRENPVAAPGHDLAFVVLPFQSLSADPEHEHLADGITDDLIEGLSRLGGTVIARGTAFTYKGKPIDIRQVGRELGVRYVLDGTVRRSGNDVRVSARLGDAATAANVWTETFDVDRRELVALREDVTDRLARILGIEVPYAGNTRSIRQRDPEAVDLMVRAKALLLRTPRGQELSEVRALFREALRRDESLAGAWSGLSFTYLRNLRFSVTPGQDLAHAAEAAERAVAIDPHAAIAHVALGSVRLGQKRIDQALAAFEHAAQLDPNEPHAHSGIAAANRALGRPEGALEPMQKALRLSPRDPWLPVWQMLLGATHLQLARDAEALHWLNKSLAVDPSDRGTRALLASALALSGREAEAKLEIAALRYPKLTLSAFQAYEPSNEPAFRARQERIYEGLRLAGLPD